MKAILIIILLFPIFAFGKSYKSKKSLKRKPAQATLTVNDLTPEFVALSNRIIGGTTKNGKKMSGVTTADELDGLIIDVDKNYSKFKDDSERLLAAQLAFMKVYRGLIFRAKGLVREHDFVRSGVVTALRFTGQATQVYLPNSQWESGFNYLVEPFAFTADQGKIENDQDFKRYLTKELIPELVKLERRVNLINFDNIIWDNRVFYKDANFVDEKDRFVKLSESEKKALKSAIYGSLSASKGLVAYSLDGFFKTIDEVAKKVGINAAFSMNKSLAEERTKIIRDGVSLNLVNSKALMQSYNYLVKSVRLAKEAMEETQGKDRDPWSLLNNDAFTAFSRVNDRIKENITNIVLPEGNRKLASAVVDGEVVEFDLKALFEKDTAPKSLKVFLPNRFDNAMTDGRKKEGSLFNKNIVKEKLGQSYIDFTYGRPIGWDQKEYQKYFPNVKSDEDIKRMVRIISQSYGGAGLGGPLSLVMF